MNSINRVGQKVRCVEPNFKHDWCPDIKEHGVPALGGEYTVGGFEDCAGFSITVPGIHLDEFTNTMCSCQKKNMPWPIVCFVPVVDDEVKNEQATEIIDKASGPVPVKIKEEA